MSNRDPDDETIESGGLRMQLGPAPERSETGRSERDHHLFVTVLLTLPYMIFVFYFLIIDNPSMLVLYGSLVYSLFAIVVYFGY